MTNLEQALTYVHRELKFMATDPSGAMNRHKYADKVIEDVTDIPNLCSAALAAAKPLAPILNAVRGPRGNALMKFFNVALHDTRVDMTMVVAEATRLRGSRNRKNQDAYEYLSSLYQSSVRKARKLVLGKSDGKEAYRDQYPALQKFAGFGGAGLDYGYDGYDDDDDDDEIYYMGDSAYASEALEALRDGRTPPPPAPRSGWGMNPSLPGNADLLRQISIIENQMGRPMTDSELDSLIMGEKVTSPKDVFENPQQPAGDPAMNALLQLVQSGAITPSSILSMIAGKANPEDPPEAPPSIDVDPSAMRQANRPPTDLEQLIRQRNQLPPKVEPQPPKELPKQQVDESPVDPPASEGDENKDGEPSSDQKGPDDESGPVDQHEDNPTEGTGEPGDTDEESADPPEEPVDEGGEESGDLGDGDGVGGGNESRSEDPPMDQTPEPEVSNELTPQELAMKDLVTTMASLSHNDLKQILENVFRQSGSELKDAFIALMSSSDPDEVMTLVVYAKAAHSSELVNTMAANNAVVGHANKMATLFNLPPDKIGKSLFLVEGDTLFDDDLKTVFAHTQVFWKEGIQRNLECAALLSYYFYKEVGLNIRADYVSDYPINSGKPTLNYIFSLYPKTEDLTFQDINEAFDMFPKGVWRILMDYFRSTDNVMLVNDTLEKFTMSIRVPQIPTEKYFNDHEDTQVDVIRGNAIAAIPGMHYLVSKVIDRIKDDLANDPSEPIVCDSVGHEFSPSMSGPRLNHEYILTVYPKTPISSDRKEEIDNMLKYLDIASATGEIAMLAAASQVKFEVYANYKDPSGDEDPATAAVEEFFREKGLVGTPENTQTNAFGLPTGQASS